MNKIGKAVLFLSCALPVIAVAADECKTHRNQLIDNSDYKIWSTVICPHQPLARHTHLHPRVLIAKKNGTLRVLYTEKILSKDNPKYFELKKGIPLYLDSTEGKDAHTDEILGDTPITVLVVELKTED